MAKLVEIKHEDPVLRTFMLFMQIAHATQQYSDNRLQRSNRLKTATYVALKGLIASGGVMSHTRLAEWTNTRKHNITGLVDRMKKAGLVTTERSETDRRLVKIEVTDKGRKLYRSAGSVARDVMKQSMRGIAQDDVLELERLLGIMRKNLTEEKDS